MRALAAAIAAPIEQEIKRKEISSLLLTKHTLPKGERPVYQKKPTVKAHWISKEGEAQEQEVGKDEVEFPTNRIHSGPDGGYLGAQARQHRHADGHPDRRRRRNPQGDGQADAHGDLVGHAGGQHRSRSPATRSPRRR